MEARARRILARFEARVDEIADEIADATIEEVPGFAGIHDGSLRAEIRALARQHLDAFLHSARAGGPPSPQILAAARERAARRARELVPLAALLHSYLIAQRVIAAAITREAGSDIASLGAALDLTAVTFKYNITATAAMADAYVEVVQGDLADLDAARRELVDTLLSSQEDGRRELARRAVGLGFDPQRRYVVVVARLDGGGRPGGLYRAGQAIARAAGQPQRKTFVVTRDRELVVLLPAAGKPEPRTVLDQAALAVEHGTGAGLRAGLGTPFTGLSGFGASHQQAHRALRHADQHRPVVSGPHDVGIFDDLVVSHDEHTAQLIPDAVRKALGDPTIRATIEALVDADLNVATAALALNLHPNSMRYRLRRVHELTGRDPRRVADLLELVTAMRILNRVDGG